MSDEKDFFIEEDGEEEIITLTDDEGEDISFRVLAHMEVDGKDYLVLEDIDEDGSVMIFEVTQAEDGTDTLNPVEDEDECQRVFDYFQADCEDYEFCDAE